MPSSRSSRLSCVVRCALAITTAAFIFAAHAFAQDYQPTPENLQARREFQDAKFGMFIHWGVYSVLGAGEWIFHYPPLPLNEYNPFPLFFHPPRFYAKTWVPLPNAPRHNYLTIPSLPH